MADVHFRRQLLHTCTVQRRTDAQNASGELIPTWADVGDVNCRYVQKQERISNESIGFPMKEQHIMLMDTGEDVVVEDRIVDIVFREDGALVEAGPFSIEAVLLRNSRTRHHISLELERIE